MQKQTKAMLAALAVAASALAPVSPALAAGNGMTNQDWWPERLDLRPLRQHAGSMTSEYVAQRVVYLAKRPRRALIIPWYYRIAVLGDWLIPGFVDWAVMTYLTSKKNRRP